MGHTFRGDDRRGDSRPAATDLRHRMAEFVVLNPTASLQDFIDALAAAGEPVPPTGGPELLRSIWWQVRWAVLGVWRD
jgi:hypothetical protein